MPIWVNHADQDDATLARVTQDDPWRAWIIWRRTSRLHGHWAPVLAAQATCRMLDMSWEPGSQSQALETWQNVSWGKVTLGAKRAADWDAVQEIPGVTVSGPDGEPALRVCLPATRTQQPPRLKRLQALVAHTAEGDPPAPTGPHAVYCVPEDVAMSLGKQCAQVAHAAMLLRIAYPEHPEYQDARDAWKDAGYPGRVRVVDAGTWTAIAEQHEAVAVRDAGLTEVAPGTHTILAYLQR